MSDEIFEVAMAILDLIKEAINEAVDFINENS